MTYQVIPVLGEIGDSRGGELCHPGWFLQQGGWELIHLCASGSSSPSWTPLRSHWATNPGRSSALLRRPKHVLTKEHTKQEAKLPNKRCLEGVSCSERFMESSLLNAAEVRKNLLIDLSKQRSDTLRHLNQGGRGGKAPKNARWNTSNKTEVMSMCEGRGVWFCSEQWGQQKNEKI